MVFSKSIIKYNMHSAIGMTRKSELRRICIRTSPARVKNSKEQMIYCEINRKLVRLFSKKGLKTTAKYDILCNVFRASGIASTICKILPVAQLDSASDSDSEGQRFESVRVGQTKSKRLLSSCFFVCFTQAVERNVSPQSLAIVCMGSESVRVRQALHFLHK